MYPYPFNFSVLTFFDFYPEKRGYRWGGVMFFEGLYDFYRFLREIDSLGLLRN